MNLPISYHDIRKISPRKARELVRKILEQTKGNVSETARIPGISRRTVRRARDGSLDDLSRAPKHIPHKTESNLENLILHEAKKPDSDTKDSLTTSLTSMDSLPPKIQ